MPTLHIYVADSIYMKLAEIGKGNPHTVGKKWIEERYEKEKEPYHT